MPTPAKLVHPKQLLVEGKDAEAFFHPFIEALGINDVEIHNYRSVTELPAFLKQFVRNADFRQLPVRSIGIVRDAENSADDAFKSICSALENAKLPLPGLKAIGKQNLTVNTFILPDGHSAGMIETLIMHAVENEPAFACIQPYLDCVYQVTGVVPKSIDKARFLAFLAAKPDYKPLTGYAARAGYLNFQSPVYDPLKAFIRSL